MLHYYSLCTIKWYWEGQQPEHDENTYSDFLWNLSSKYKHVNESYTTLHSVAVSNIIDVLQMRDDKEMQGQFSPKDMTLMLEYFCVNFNT